MRASNFCSSDLVMDGCIVIITTIMMYSHAD